MNAPEQAHADLSPAKVNATMLPIEQLTPDPNQPRKTFDADALSELAGSIEEHGIIEPIVVRPDLAGHVIIAGERRYRAAQMAGLKEVPVVIRETVDESDIGSLQLIENIQREGLTMPEECAAVAKLVEKIGGKAAALKLGKSEAWVSKRVGVMQAPKEVRDLVDAGKVSDTEIANGLAELMRVGSKKQIEDALTWADNPDDYRGKLTREKLRSRIQDAKDAAQRRADAAEARKQAKATGKPSNPATDRAKQEKDQKQQRIEKWKALMPDLRVLADQAKLMLGAEAAPPHVNEYSPSAPPATIEAATFNLRVQGTAEQVQKIVSRTGLTVKLTTYDHSRFTPEQAAKVEQILGTKLRWVDSVDLTGKQLQGLIEKAAQTHAAPVATEPKKPAPKPAAKPAKASKAKPAAKKGKK